MNQLDNVHKQGTVPKPDIIKINGIIIRDKKVLMVREHNEIFLAPPGGTRKANEGDLECLRRELYEELGVEKFTIENDGLPIFLTPLAPAATQPDKLLQVINYFVRLHAEPHTTYDPVAPQEGEDIEELFWLGKNELYLVENKDGSIEAKLKDNSQGYRLTYMNEHNVTPKLIKMGLIEEPNRIRL